VNLHGPVRAAKTAGSGTAELTISFDAWVEGRVAPTRHKVSVVAPKSNKWKLEPVSPRLIRKLIHPDRKASLYALRFSEGGAKLFASGYPSGVVQLWDAKTWKELRRVETPPGLRGTSNYAALSPDWTRMYVPTLVSKFVRGEKDGKRAGWREYNGSVRVWDLTTGREQPPIPTPGRGPQQVILSPDGERMVLPMNGSGNATKPISSLTETWSLTTRTGRKMCDGFGQIAFAPDGKTLAALVTDYATKRSTLRTFNAVGTKELAHFDHAGKDGQYISGPQFTPDGRELVVQHGGKKGEAATFWFFDPKTLARTGEVAGAPNPGGTGWVFTPVFSPDGRKLAGADMAGQVSVYGLTTRKHLRTWSVGTNIRTFQTLFSPDGRRLYVNAMLNLSRADIGEDTDPADMPQPRVYMFDLESKSDQPAEVIYAPPGYLGNMAISPDGRTLAVGTSGGVLLFDVSDRAKP
jgi:WD40 repeat protein